MKVSAIITAAGLGKRMNSATPKQFLKLSGRPILIHTLEKFDASKYIGSTVVVTEPSWVKATEEMLKDTPLIKEWQVVEGGDQRQDSVKNGLDAIPPDTEIVVIHDGVRPFIASQFIDKSIEIARDEGSCIVAVPISDTVKRVGRENVINETVDRVNLWAAQTPQTFRYEIIKRAFDEACKSNYYGTDEASLVERMGEKVKLLMGSRKNIKITTPEDLEIAEALVFDIGRMRIGIGYDLHRLVEGRRLILGGVNILYKKGLLGHSDADVLLHAVTDAILGAASLGDIGKHFPDTDPEYKDVDSRDLLRKALKLVAHQGYRVKNIDSIVIAEEPRVAPHTTLMRENISSDLGIEINCVSVKATTNEGIGEIGKGEAIAAQAVALLENPKSKIQNPKQIQNPKPK